MHLRKKRALSTYIEIDGKSEQQMEVVVDLHNTNVDDNENDTGKEAVP